MATEIRPICANRLKKVLDDSLEGTYSIEDSKTASVMAGTIIACGILIDEMPTLDAVEVVHGQWVKPYINAYGHPCHVCSVCGFKASHQDKNYCANCGAKMDEGKDSG